MTEVNSGEFPLHWALNHALSEETIPPSFTRDEAIKAAFFLGATAYDTAVTSSAMHALKAHREVKSFHDFSHAVSQELARAELARVEKAADSED